MHFTVQNVTDTNMKRFGLIGHPISHSLSPVLFKAAYEGKYPYDLIEGEDFEASYRKFLEEYQAINVTAPFKEMAFRKADIATDECKAIGAANILLKRDDGKILAANSDKMGVIAAVMAGLYPDRIIKPVTLIVGGGGAAKAAAYASGEIKHEVIIINRNFDRARDYAQRLNLEYGMNVTARPMEDFCRYFRKAGVIIYTLPVPVPMLESLSGNDIRGNTFLRKENKVVVEANYRDPAFTPEIKEKWMRINPKLRFVGGEEWLLHQAVGAYLAFTHEEPDIEKMRMAIR